MPRIIKRADIDDKPALVGVSRSRKFDASLFGTEPSNGDGDGEPAEEARIDPVAEAEARAARIIAEAEARAEEMLREAVAKGYAEGKEAGLRAAEEQTREQLERLASLARQAAIDRESMVRSAEQELAALALEIAAKVIRREVSCDPTVVLNVVEGALEKVGTTDAVRILVHPDDVELVRERWADLKGAVALGTDWEIAGDDRIERGGCIIETRSGMVDGRIEAQLAEIVSAFEVGQ